MKNPFRFLGVAAAVLFVLPFASGCSKSFKEGFNVGFCSSYQENFVKSCVDTCSKKAERSLCEPGCADALKTDKTFSDRCKETPTGRAVYGSAPATP